MSPLTNITAAILAGGLGTRLRSVVADRPKVMAEVSGRPFMAYLLDQLADAGVKRVVLCVGYKGELVRELLGDTYREMHLLYSQEIAPLGTGGALRQALPLLKTDTTLVMNGDSYCSANLPAFATWHEIHQSPVSLLLIQTEDTRRFGRVDDDGQGQILRFQEKADTSGPGWINAGLYLLQRPFIETIPRNQSVSIEREIFPSWIGRGLHGYRSEGRLWDIGLPESYAQANIDFVKHRPN